MERKSGFYWVKPPLNKDGSVNGCTYDGWLIAEYYEPRRMWTISGAEIEFDDDDFWVINENRIMSPGEWE